MIVSPNFISGPQREKYRKKLLARNLAAARCRAFSEEELYVIRKCPDWRHYVPATRWPEEGPWREPARAYHHIEFTF